MRILNLTPHAITFRHSNGSEITLAPEPVSARVVSRKELVDVYPGIPIPVAPFPEPGLIDGLPGRQEATIYIVSLIVLSHHAVRGIRKDVFAPGTGPLDGAIRNEKGQVTAVTRLISSM